jgi:hypothetical protein
MEKNNSGNPVEGVATTANPERLRDLDRVKLADVREMWSYYQTTKSRSSVYAYLHMVFMQVDWWTKNPEEKGPELQIYKEVNPGVNLPADEYSLVIACTADPRKIDHKMRSKLSRVLRYAEEFKPPKELLRDFLQRKGGINKCAARYTRRLGRNRKRQKVGS